MEISQRRYHIKHLIVKAVTESEALGKVLEKYPDSLGKDWEIYSIDTMEEIHTIAEHVFTDYN